MSDPKDEDPKKRSGRVGFDERGNSVWEWQLETGVYSRDITTQKLKKLDLDDLSIAETAKHERPKGLVEDRKELPGGGFNPYDNSPPVGGEGGNPYNNARNTGQKFQPAKSAAPAPKSQPAKPGAPPAPRKPVDLQKLEEWMKIKKRVEEAKKNEQDDD